MELADNLVMAVIPGAMEGGLVNPIFWLGMIVALSAAFVAAFPVNRYLIDKGKGHALTHQYHQGHGEPGHHLGAVTPGESNTQDAAASRGAVIVSPSDLPSPGL